ncbi:hypothetical protein AXF42_Ash008003 [Apostasia shenzhenica]|uniref:Uncharacterized protein n=1 Tax=Apostasia shenzhenica TaxID=1088818 RepID=A0A2I0A8C4_9ASPA|nr:hypothetical protein AXF42_Ash008003 [Apostasia shenzhenica]
MIVVDVEEGLEVEESNRLKKSMRYATDSEKNTCATSSGSKFDPVFSLCSIYFSHGHCQQLNTKKTSMGNCVHRPLISPATAAAFAGDEHWEYHCPDHDFDNQKKHKEHKNSAGETTMQVKIVITKKQWEELTTMSHSEELQSLKLHHLLSFLSPRVPAAMEIAGGRKIWKPSLQSIPEISE